MKLKSELIQSVVLFRLPPFNEHFLSISSYPYWYHRQVYLHKSLTCCEKNSKKLNLDFKSKCHQSSTYRIPFTSLSYLSQGSIQKLPRTTFHESWTVVCLFERLKTVYFWKVMECCLQRRVFWVFRVHLTWNHEILCSSADICIYWWYDILCRSSFKIFTDFLDDFFI